MATADADGFAAYLRAAGREPLLSAEDEVELARRIEAGVLAADWLSTRPDLPAPLRADLVAVAADGERAKRRMIEANLPLVIFTVRRFVGQGLDFEELVAEGNLGLIRAVEMFEYRLGNKFSTYATWWISAGRLEGHRQPQPHRPHPGAPVAGRAEGPYRLLTLRERHRGEPTAEEVAAEVGESQDVIERVLAGFAVQPTSLDALIGSDCHGQTTLADLIEDGDAPDPGGTLAESSTSDDFDRVLATLPRREAAVLRAVRTRSR